MKMESAIAAIREHKIKVVEASKITDEEIAGVELCRAIKKMLHAYYIGSLGNIDPSKFIQSLKEFIEKLQIFFPHFTGEEAPEFNLEDFDNISCLSDSDCIREIQKVFYIQELNWIIEQKEDIESAINVYQLTLCYFNRVGRILETSDSDDSISEMQNNITEVVDLICNGELEEVEYDEFEEIVKEIPSKEITDSFDGTENCLFDMYARILEQLNRYVKLYNLKGDGLTVKEGLQFYIGQLLEMKSFLNSIPNLFTPFTSSKRLTTIQKKALNELTL